MKKLIIICGIICVILGGKIVWFIFRPEPAFLKTNWNADYTGKVHQLPTDLNKYTCVDLERLTSTSTLKYCEEIKPRIIPQGEARVGGQYFRDTTTILMEYNASNDNKVHEFLHHVINCTRTHEEELCVREVQKMLLEKQLI